jgi:hypothetical protein
MAAGHSQANRALPADLVIEERLRGYAIDYFERKGRRDPLDWHLRITIAATLANAITQP